ncbi:ATP-binding protein [Streptomyces ochraceiscleroticus]|uniref:ATP-binding protein n=1 Tax=Streptomyces ochraceiscleroticus TaxID=47761 RepID=A0ABW1MKM0_9ACTN|nr:ATP-binding protein [Streptomyces ochraceiscleroticus]
MSADRLLELDFTGPDLPLARITLAATLHRAGLPGPVRDALAQAVLEAMANAVLHGGGAGRLSVGSADGEVRCEVADAGPGPSAVVPAPESLAPEPRTPDAGQEAATGRGHGLRIAEALTDRIEVHPGPGDRGTTVVLAASLRTAVPAPGSA